MSTKRNNQKHNNLNKKSNKTKRNNKRQPKSDKLKLKSNTSKSNKKIYKYSKKTKGGFMKFNRCQCIDYKEDKKGMHIKHNPTAKQCSQKTVNGTPFCAKHQNCGKFLKQYINNFEHKYSPNEWNHPYIEGSHNCYTYFLNNQIQAVQERCDELCKKHSKGNCPKKVEQCSNLKPQPGDYFHLLTQGNINKGPNNYSCPLMESRIMGDNEQIKKVKFDAKCPKYYYKGAMVVDPNHTYHFYRQNEDGTWSHKPGTLPVTKEDADGKVIYAPHIADRNYNKNNKKGGINYVDFCGYYCVPNNKYLNTHAI